MPTKLPRSFDRKFVPLSTRFDHALLFASQVHREQDRKKSGIPYISHLLGVASIVLDYGGDEEMAIAALLHDAVEDHGGMPRLHEIEERFGPEVSRMVAALSDTFAEHHDKKEGWEERKNNYLTRLREEPDDVLLISAADKLYNAKAILDDYRDIGPAVFDRFKRGAKEQLWYFDELLRIFRAHPPNRIVNDLEGVVQELRVVTSNKP